MPDKIIVVGGGTSGLILTHQLLQLGKKVLLICDEGDKSNDLPSKTIFEDYLSLIPLHELWTVVKRDLTKSFIFETVEQKYLVDRKLDIFLGRGLGGSSNINAMIHFLGHKSSFDKLWPKSWSYDIIHDAEISIDELIQPFILSSGGFIKSIFDTGTERIEISSGLMGYPACLNLDGTHRFDLKSILNPFNKDNNQLEIIEQRVKLINFDSSKKVSSIVLENNSFIKIEKDEEIVLSSGALETPRVLKNSIVHFYQSQNRINHNESILQHIGENFQDHVILPHLFIGNWYSKFGNNQYPFNSVHGWIYLDEHGNILEDPNNIKPSCQLLFVDGNITPGLTDLLLPNTKNSPWIYQIFRPVILFVLRVIFSLSIVRWVCGNVFGVLICNINTKSRGSLHIPEINNSVRDLKIDPNYLSNPEDKQVLIQGIKASRKLFEQAKSKNPDFFYFEVFPGFLFSIDTFIKLFTLSYFHYCGTCAMGTVVDEELNVKGFSGLRIADASIIPYIPTAPIAKLCMVIGALAAKMINKK